MATAKAAMVESLVWDLGWHCVQWKLARAAHVSGGEASAHYWISWGQWLNARSSGRFVRASLRKSPGLRRYFRNAMAAAHNHFRQYPGVLRVRGGAS